MTVPADQAWQDGISVNRAAVHQFIFLISGLNDLVCHVSAISE
jgi:hypothetical protein